MNAYFDGIINPKESLIHGWNGFCSQRLCAGHKDCQYDFATIKTEYNIYTLIYHKVPGHDNFYEINQVSDLGRKYLVTIKYNNYKFFIATINFSSPEFEHPLDNIVDWWIGLYEEALQEYYERELQII